MKNKLIVPFILLVSFNVSADYTNDDGLFVHETVLESDLREKIDCLASSGGDLDYCDVNGNAVFDEGDIAANTVNFNGAVSSASEQLSGDTSNLSSISFTYSGADNYEHEADFSHFQSCEYLKHEIKSRYQGQYPVDMDAGDSGIAFGEYVNYQCAGNSYLFIEGTNITGPVHHSTGQAEGIYDKEMNCTTARTRQRIGMSGSLTLTKDTFTCDGTAYTAGHIDTQDSAPSTPMVPTALSCTNPAFNSTFSCTTETTGLLDYKYERHYDVVATPTSVNNGSISYDVSISYTFKKHRTVPIEEYELVAPVDVSGITIFIPVPPSFPNEGYSRTQFHESDINISSHNSSQVEIGCDSHKKILSMTEKYDGKTLRSGDITQLLGSCDDITTSFKKLTTDSQLFWDIDYIRDANETALWEKYATLLTNAVSDNLISASYIGNLQSAADQSVADTQAVIQQVSAYILGNYAFQTGLRGFLRNEGSAWGIANNEDSINSEISTLLTDGSSDYGENALDLSTTPEYWFPFLYSAYAQNINIFDQTTLLTMSKNIIDLSAGGDASTLLEQMSLVADAAQNEHNQTIDKASLFLDTYVAQRSDLEQALAPQLQALRDAISAAQD